MKNIEMKNVMEVKALVETYKKYKSIYDHTAQMFDRDKEYSVSCDIFHALDSNIEEALDSIGQWLSDLYQDWAGLREKREEDFESRDAYYEWEDDINFAHEDIAGVCGDMVGVENWIYSKMYYLPVDFMNEFIAEYGMFRVDDNNDVWVA